MANEKPKSRVFEEIESSANFHAPLTYVQLLGHYTAFEDSLDTRSAEFIPVSQTKVNPKLFVVGLLPPATTITGRLLDRSAALSRSLGSQTGADTSGAGSSGTVSYTSPYDGTGLAVVKQGTSASATKLPDSFWTSYVQMCSRLKVNPYNLAAVLNAESGFAGSAENFAAGKSKPPVAKGLNQLIYSTFAGVVRRRQPGATDAEIKAQWDVYHTLPAEEQLPYVEAYFSGVPGLSTKTPGQLYQKNFGGYPNPDGSLYASKAAQDAWIAQHPEDAGKFKDPAYQQKVAEQNAGLFGPDGRSTQAILDSKVNGGPPAYIKQKIDEAVARSGGKVPPPVAAPKSSGDKPANWQGNGSENAASSKKEAEKTQTKDLNTTELGRRYQEAQKAEIFATAMALENMKNTPPLRFLVNPQSFKVNSEKIVSDGNWTRNGPIIEHWGDGQDKIEFAGKVAAFMAIDANSPRADNESGGSPGLTRLARSYSASYQNFMSLLMLYRNNGGLYISGMESDTKEAFQSRLSLVGSMYIYYDGILYLGSFDNFNVTENDTAPHTLEYNIQFTCRASFVLDQPPDPRETTAYGPAATKFFAPARTIPGTGASTGPGGQSDQAALKAEAERRRAEQRNQLGAADAGEAALTNLLNGGG